ncbi:MAG: hypothetical protein RQ724_04220 [Desulfuromonadales bacterium]|nr:hypothetical protein [Desulfuromonadales bacterium]
MPISKFFLWLLAGVFLCGLNGVAGAAFQQVNFIGQVPCQPPEKIAVDQEGRIYVTTENGAAFVLDQEGKVLFTLGKPGSRRPEVEKASGIALYGDTVYVADRGLDRIAMFTRDGEFLGSFGADGSDPKEFDDPGGIAIFDGNIFVADTDNARIQIFGPNGVFLGFIGNDGNDDARLREPVDLTLDCLGNLYVVDAGDDMVKIYNPAGKYLGNVRGLSEPCAIAMNEGGFYIADRDGYNVTKFDLSGKQLLRFGTRGKGRAQFQKVSGLSVDAAGQLYVADLKNKNIQIFAMENGTKIAHTDRNPPRTSVKWLGDAALEAHHLYWDAGDKRLLAVDNEKNLLNIYRDLKLDKSIRVKGWEPVAAAVDPQGNIWALDRDRGRLLKLADDGAVLLSVGESGSRNGSFSKPSDLAISHEGIIYVADTGNERIQAFNTDGVFLAVLGKNSGRLVVEEPITIEIGPNKNLYVLDNERRAVVVFSPDGKPAYEFGGGKDKDALQGPVNLAVTDDEVFVLDAATSDVKVYALDGTLSRRFGAPGTGKGDFSRPTAMVTLDAITFVVADAAGKRLQTFQTIYTPPAVTELQASEGMRQVRLDWSVSPYSYVTSYRVYRANAVDGPFEKLTETSSSSCLDTAVEPQTAYYYRVSAVARGGNEGARTAAVNATPARAEVAPLNNVRAVTQEWSVELQWDECNAPFFDHYNIYRNVSGEFSKVGESKEPIYVATGLDPSTEYVFRVSAVSIDQMETVPVEIKAITQIATRPPIEYAAINISNVFSNTYKLYENEGIGVLTVANNTRARIASLKVKFKIKDFMDFPTEVEIKDLGPRSSAEVVLKAVFNNKILDVTEDTPVQTEIEISYYENSNLKTFTRNHTINIYEKHRMMWDVRERFATFIAPKDSVILEFVRTITTQYPEVDDPLLYAGVIFDALGVVGVTYMQDPSNPYQKTSEHTDFIDYIQYPRETLQRRSGDCDDLVALYSSMMESIGVRTKAVEVPGHMFMMFATPLDFASRPESMTDLFVVDEEILWIPVEVTMVGSSFLKAWEKGGKNYHDWAGRGLTTMDIRAAWEKFKPASLPSIDWRPQPVKRSEIEKKFDELKSLKKIRMGYLTKALVDTVRAEPDNYEPMLQLGIVYAEEGELDEASRMLLKAEELAPGDASIKNNLGNVNYLQEDFDQALYYYQLAAELDAEDPYIQVNLARAYLGKDMKEDAVNAFKRAMEMDITIATKYRKLALELTGPI